MPWEQDGLVRGSDLHIAVRPPGCGWLAGMSRGGNAKSVTVSIDGLVPEEMFTAFCPFPATVRKVIHLGPPSNPGAPPPVATSTTKILHAKTGPIRATR
ncbi:MAG TPA: hypothetical protein VMV96_05640 [Acidimicrobiales bacterium]|nr:hypothetical protein [Acidimicrobiales bacterium]